jgi:hypothetical protein
VPSSAREPSLAFVSSSIPILVSSSDDNIEDENPPPPAHLPPDVSIEHEPVLAPLLPRWVCSTQEAIDELASDPTDQHCTHSQL